MLTFHVIKLKLLLKKNKKEFVRNERHVLKKFGNFEISYIRKKINVQKARIKILKGNFFA
jgi:hypothetical protein